MKKIKTLYSLLHSFDYQDGIFGAGLVKNSIHSQDKIFLQINNNIFELRDDEIYAIIASLSQVLWCNYQYYKQDKVKLKWRVKEQLNNLWKRRKTESKTDRKRDRR